MGDNPKQDASQQQVGIDRAFGTTKAGDATAANTNLFPFLNQEITNPTGFGDDTVAKMKTGGGEAIAGAQGQATEAAQLLGSRTGNTAAMPGIIDASARNAMKAGADNSREIDISNAKAKLGQQQAGASGLNSQYDADTRAALEAMGLTNGAINGIGGGTDVSWNGANGLSIG